MFGIYRCRLDFYNRMKKDTKQIPCKRTGSLPKQEKDAPMTVYVCQIRQQLPSMVWEEDTEEDVIRICEGDRVDKYDNIEDAISDDMRMSYHTTDLLDLYVWIQNHDPDLVQSGARRDFFRFYSSDVEELATRIEDPLDKEEIAWTAFDGRFVFHDSTDEWSLDGGELHEAVDLAHGICAAALKIDFEESLAARKKG